MITLRTRSRSKSDFEKFRSAKKRRMSGTGASDFTLLVPKSKTAKSGARGGRSKSSRSKSSDYKTYSSGYTGTSKGRTKSSGCRTYSSGYTRTPGSTRRSRSGGSRTGSSRWTVSGSRSSRSGYSRSGRSMSRSHRRRDKGGNGLCVFLWIMGACVLLGGIIFTLWMCGVIFQKKEPIKKQATVPVVAKRQPVAPQMPAKPIYKAPVRKVTPKKKSYLDLAMENWMPIVGVLVGGFFFWYTDLFGIFGDHVEGAVQVVKIQKPSNPKGGYTQKIKNRKPNAPSAPTGSKPDTPQSEIRHFNWDFQKPKSASEQAELTKFVQHAPGAPKSVPNGEPGQFYYPNSATEYAKEGLEVIRDMDHLDKIRYGGKTREAYEGRPPLKVPVPDDYQPFQVIRDMPHAGTCGTHCTKNDDCIGELFCCGSYNMCMDPTTNSTGAPEIGGPLPPHCKKAEDAKPARDVKHVYTGIDREWAFYELLHPDPNAYNGDYNG